MRVGMIGPSPDQLGGIASVTRTLLGSSSLGAFTVEHHVPGSTPRDVLAQFLRFTVHVRRSPAALYHVHVGAPILARPATHRYTSILRENTYARYLDRIGLPHVLHLHGSDGIRDFHGLSPRHAAIVEHWFACARAVIVLSRDMERTVREWTRDRACVVRLPNAVDLSRFSPALSTPSHRVVFTGRMQATKGIYDLLEAAGSVLRTVRDGTFVLAGDGDPRPFARACAARGLQQRVQSLGPIQGTDVPALLASAQVYALPSHGEGMPVSVLEAMASGLPVVATRVAAMPELVDDGETGFLVEVGDIPSLAAALTRLLREPRRCVTMGRRGRERVERLFDRDRLAGQLADLWKRAAKEPPRCH